MLLVNLDFKIGVDGLKELVSKNRLQITTILDFSNCIKQTDSLKIIYPKDFDKDFEIHREAIKVYIYEVGKISEALLEDGKILRDIEFAGFPVYWITQISIKHAQLSIVKNFFYLLELIKSRYLEDFTKQEIILCLPSKEFYFNELFQKKLKEKFNISSQSYSLNQETKIYLNWNRLSFFKNVFKSYSEVRKKCKELKKDIENNTSDISIFTYPNSTWLNQEKHDYVFKELQEYIQTKHSTNYIPFFTASNGLNELKKWEDNWDTGLLDHFPSRLSTLVFVFKHYRFSKKVNSINISKNNSQRFVDTKIIKKELNDIVFLNHWRMFYYYWLKNYFSNGINTQKRVFYQDEFYDGGRLISHAKNKSGNNLIKTFGVQHGLFFSGHTVYSITDSEIKGDNSMPIPDKFIVWGKVFKNEFLKNNTLNQDYVVEAGNFRYNSRYNNLTFNTNNRTHNKKTFLWCVTLGADTIQMFEIIKGELNLMKELEIIVRCHPLHNIKNLIIDLFSSIGYSAFTFSNNQDIFNDIEKAGLMISSNASTTFIDGLIGDIPIVNVVLPDYQMDKFEVHNLHNVKNDKEFKEALEIIFCGKEKDKKNDFSQINASVDNWNMVLN